MGCGTALFLVVVADVNCIDTQQRRKDRMQTCGLRPFYREGSEGARPSPMLSTICGSVGVFPLSVSALNHSQQCFLSAEDHLQR